MSDTTTTAYTITASTVRDSRCKTSRPERIAIGDDTWVRNDVQADSEGRSERSLNEDDARGAPYAFIGNVKYRPLKRYHEWQTRGIRQAI